MITGKDKWTLSPICQKCDNHFVDDERDDCGYVTYYFDDCSQGLNDDSEFMYRNLTRCKLFKSKI